MNADSRRNLSPADQCKDGSYTKAQTKKGACSQHGGVTTWFAEEKAATTTPAPKGGTPAAKGTTADAPKTTTGKAPTKSASGAPENATAKCKDGTFSFANQHRGACSHHGGVAEWYK